MERYDYLAALETDIKNGIEWNEYNPHEFDSRNECESAWNDAMMFDDSITGNASGSYYCNTWKAEEAICHNWDIITECWEEYGYDGMKINNFSPESMDVCIRCYLLGTAISNVLDEIEDTIPEWN